MTSSNDAKATMKAVRIHVSAVLKNCATKMPRGPRPNPVRF